jgi:sulfocyanin
MKIYIPANWSIRLTYTNENPLPHGAVLIKPNVSVPSIQLSQDGQVIVQLPQGALSGNYLTSGQSATAFSPPLQIGLYWIACPYPGHAASGMWVDVIVAANVTAPYYVVT